MIGTLVKFDAPLDVETPHGSGVVLFVIDYGWENNACWTVANKKDGQIRHYVTCQLQLSPNSTFRIK